MGPPLVSSPGGEGRERTGRPESPAPLYPCRGVPGLHPASCQQTFSRILENRVDIISVHSHFALFVLLVEKLWTPRFPGNSPQQRESVACGASLQLKSGRATYTHGKAGKQPRCSSPVKHG
ncbi:hypothetical protein H920_09598 [Fukomys damarensis]|uniref:Uncharacterized protein n=1 Tax=Fukomys damarensis TaxID=885580 RepID=A0A091DEL4_FUKDA|nr:hypothetical protein H920_09598 [Fukomys damarensis]